MPAPLPQDQELGPEELLTQWLARRGTEDELDLERLCQQHPRSADELRALHADWARVVAILDGQPVDPAPPALEPCAEALPAEGGSVAWLLARLADRVEPSDRLRDEHEISRSAMARLVRVWDVELERPLAKKVVLTTAATPGGDEGVTPPQVRQLMRFVREARTTARLDHPGIVPVHEVGLDVEGHAFFTMKLVEGRTLQDVLDQLSRGEGGWTRSRVLGLLLKVCEAMSYAHAKGVIHRDLKPANVMVGRFGEVYVMDWGLAKVLGSKDGKDLRIRERRTSAPGLAGSRESGPTVELPDSPLLTMDGDVVGTPAYMPPEQAEGRVAEMGPHSDVYAVGAMLYHLLAGHMPYVRPGERVESREVWRRVKAGSPPALHREAPRAPAELVAICERAMARAPAARYADMSALADDLRAHLEGRVVHAYESGAWPEARKWARRNRPLAAALLAAVVLAFGGLASTSYVQARGREAERQQRERAEAETAKVLRLSDMKVLQELRDEADELWPAHPERITGLEAWLERARELSANLEVHRETLAGMRARARSGSDDRPTRNGEDLRPRSTWRFDSAEDQWQHDLLVELIGELEGLVDGLLAEDATTPGHGWSIPKRLAFARDLESGFAPGGPHARAWSEALAAIRDAYPGLGLTPQMGLLPLGSDPRSGLWEFAHLMTGEPAERGADGRLILSDETGIVLVLLRGGRFWMGAQSDDPNGHNYDPLARQVEGPVHAVELSAFFLSKYEMTQGQWSRLTGRNPSYHQQRDLASDRLHPVEHVSWFDCMAWLPRAGLGLPSEAQWEYGARGGSDTPWWTGQQRESLSERHAANLADRTAASAGAPWQDIQDWPELDDGYADPAPVGTYAANAFGLHEVAGNLWEWCLDGYDGGFYGRSPEVDPVAPRAGVANRVFRGGCFTNAAHLARSAVRYEYGPPSAAVGTLGVRPARAIDR